MLLEEIYKNFITANNLKMAEVELSEGLPMHRIFIVEINGQEFYSYSLCFEEEQIFVYYIDLGVPVENADRTKVLYTLEKINLMLKLGSFMMREDGTVILKVTQYMFGDDEARAACMKQVIHSAVLTVEYYYQSLVEAIN